MAPQASRPGLVAVTGATGFLGRRLLPVLAADGWRLRVLARGTPQPWPDLEPEVVRGDLSGLKDRQTVGVSPRQK